MSMESVKCRTSELTVTLLRERAAEEGVSFAALVRRALAEWMTITEGQERDYRAVKINGPKTHLPTVSVSHRMHLDLRMRGRGSLSDVIRCALDEWLLL